ncbi:alpha/beta fold hydrolase [Alkaliphilus serpentinus]|uniref:Alpha/beta hydrolase n=1 Tax=Alkaliphilus serpentinus TaxID=1482731 RepID=A0A833HPR7_9FIRM|nr:alpha/beta hydrolase [Alkaliphilus serpentinus]KAB3531146.1 alpha/beta hydrolase [Alkaliphilus serpentinus]
MFGINNGSIESSTGEMAYVAFGKGKEALFIIPGLSDGIQTVKNKGLLLSWYYKVYAEHYRVYVISRLRPTPQGYTTKDMAKDIIYAMDKLDKNAASIVGFSMGGMIAQYVAIDYPERVKKLVIGISISKPNETLKKVVGKWIRYAIEDDYGALTLDTMEKTFTQKHLRKYRPFYPIIKRMGKPLSLVSFIVQANACIEHNSYGELSKIKAPTLIIGGDEDYVVGPNTSEEMADMIRDSKLILLKGLGHGAYEEDKKFNERVLKFLLKED